MGSGTCQARVRGELPDGASTPGGAERSGANAVSGGPASAGDGPVWNPSTGVSAAPASAGETGP